MQSLSLLCLPGCVVIRYLECGVEPFVVVGYPIINSPRAIVDDFIHTQQVVYWHLRLNASAFVLLFPERYLMT